MSALPNLQCLGAIALLALSNALLAQTLSTDRAEFTVTTDVVDKGVFQTEGGFLLEVSPDSRLWHGPCPLARAGLGNKLEIRIGGDGLLAESTVGSPYELGVSDVSIGIKWKIFGENRYRPAVALSPSVSTPAGAKQFSSAGYDPTVRLAVSKTLVRGFRSSGNLNLSALTDGRRFLQRAASLCIEHDLDARLVAFTEIYSLSSLHSGGGVSNMLNFGLFRNLGTRLQIDAEAGRRLSDCGPAWFVGLGFVVRLGPLR